MHDKIAITFTLERNPGKSVGELENAIASLNEVVKDLSPGAQLLVFVDVFCEHVQSIKLSYLGEEDANI
ncbi:MAG: hypothetical protein ACXAEN_27420 [Candidatus Thorarchaeota archaeon]|jgi:hypothetical protein